MTNALARSTSLLLAVLTLATCSAQTSASRGPGAPAPATPSAKADAAGIATAKADSLRYPYTAADVHFMQGMIGHHSQAIAMASWAPTHGASSSVRILAERIINAQQDEIVTMQQWLTDRRQTVPEAKAKPMKMMVNGKEQEMLMPGMLTEAQMHQLDLATGPEFDRLFLTDMIQHHRGAVSMVQDLFGTYGAAQDELTFKFASDVNVDQTTEIARMERMLNSASFEQHAQ
ncbi:MAG: DUF305 domain-containing protein [Gemmatimonadaceae bacterium]|nr:DUF305 domain-containing protein [Gemmatimonadaceae bacterium]